MRKIIVVFILELLSCVTLYAEFGGLHFRNISIDSGLSDNLVLAIEKDKYGFVWIGTSEGLNRYDGYRFDIYKNYPDDSTSLSSSRRFSNSTSRRTPARFLPRRSMLRPSTLPVPVSSPNGIFRPKWASSRTRATVSMNGPDRSTIMEEPSRCCSTAAGVMGSATVPTTIIGRMPSLCRTLEITITAWCWPKAYTN
ncbi:MAG TPA: hypothetical protein H9879_09335 [Candidatus Alistipes intestinipullorum]|nr:hypothetical protein [Candidatus Alistipes intestinipullorum]